MKLVAHIKRSGFDVIGNVKHTVPHSVFIVIYSNTLLWCLLQKGDNPHNDERMFIVFFIIFIYVDQMD